MPIMNLVRSIGGPYDPFRLPTQVAVDPAGSVYVVDLGGPIAPGDSNTPSFVAKFDRSGKFVLDVGGGSSKAVVKDPHFVTVGADGNVYIADGTPSFDPSEGYARVLKFDGGGNLLLTWGAYGTDQGEFEYLAGMAIDAAGFVYVADWANVPPQWRIQKFDGSGKFVLAWPLRCAYAGIATDSGGDVYVTDSIACCVYQLDSSGNVKRTWGKKGSGNGEFGPTPTNSPFEVSGPSGVAVDSAGNVYVSDPANHRVQKFDSEGNFKFAWPDSATGGLQVPVGLAVDSADNVYVVDAQARRVFQFNEVKSTRPTFQPLQPGDMFIYVLGSDGNLWYEIGPFGSQIPPNRVQIDGDVTGFQALDGNNAVVLGSDENLWWETSPWGDINHVIQTRKQIDGNVGAFQVVQTELGNAIFVLGTDGTLWSEIWPPIGDVAQTIATRQRIDTNVRAFKALTWDVGSAVVLGSDGNLWWEQRPWGSGNKQQIDGGVKAFQPLDAYNIFVLGTDGTLWFESWPEPDPNAPGSSPIWGNVQQTINNRKVVDTNVAAFQAIDVNIDLNTVFVLGSDGNLWLEKSPWGNVDQMTQTRQHVDSDVEAFNVWIDEHHTIGDWVVLVKDTDHVLWYKESSDGGATWSRMQIDTNVM